MCVRARHWHERGPMRAKISRRLWAARAAAALSVALVASAVIAAQAAPDPLGRDTPRGAVLGFLDAARRGDYAVARQYLDTPLDPGAAERLARQLFVVLDARLPARLTEISNEPEGSRAQMLQLDRELVGTIDARQGPVEIVVARVTRNRPRPLWLFSDRTLDAVPALFEEVMAAQRATAIPRVLVDNRIAGLRLLDWIVLLASIPLFFAATAMLNRLLLPIGRPLWRWIGDRDAAVRHNILPIPARLLLLAILGRWILAWLPFSLVVRQFWSSAAGLIAIVAVVWLLILLNGEIEELLHRRLPRATFGAGSALLRVLRRVVDIVIVFGGIAVVMWRLGINPMPALAGLGVGGLAVALAAQKTLENVIAGASLIFDQAVRVGDFLRMGTTEGIVDHIGLRSTRIRTVDRTIVSIPNGQIANVSLETLSARDKYRLHHEVRLRYDTTPQQLVAVLEGIRERLSGHPAVDPASIRVRFIRLGQFSFDIEVFAYLLANDWGQFLENQEALLLAITDTVQRAGVSLALPSQTLYVADILRAERTHPAGARPGMAAGVG